MAPSAIARLYLTLVDGVTKKFRPDVRGREKDALRTVLAHREI
jgi:hypothetical protein